MTGGMTGGMASHRAGPDRPDRPGRTRPDCPVRLVRLDGLTAEQLDAWHALRQANPLLDSPYFHPGFAAAVHDSGREVHVAVVTGPATHAPGTPGASAGAAPAVRALLPVHRDRSRLRPVGWPGADFQGPVLAPGTGFPLGGLLTAGVRALEFDHLLEGLADADFEPWIESRRPSPYLDVTGGLDGYLGRASRSGKDNMGQARRRAAKAEREHGTLRFAADVVDGDALARLIELKRAQYAATGARDYFAEPGRERLLTGLLHTRGTEFGGMLSTLHAGPHLIAAHFGLRSGSVLHWWFPVYDPAFARSAPGWILLRELVAAAPTLGITRIDLGRGEDEYKRRAKTGETAVCQGAAVKGTTARTLRRARGLAVAGAKASPLAPALRRTVRALHSPRTGE